MRFSFFLSEALESLRRNWVMTLASILTVFISMGILGVVLVIDRNLDQGATSLKNRVLIEVFIRNNATPEEIKTLEAKIVAIPEVKSHTYISKDQALEEFKKKLGEDADQILAQPADQPAAGVVPRLRQRRRHRSTRWPRSSSTIPTVDNSTRHARRRALRTRDGAQDARHHRPHREGHVGRHGASSRSPRSCSSQRRCGSRSSPAGARSRSCSSSAPRTGSSAGRSCSRASSPAWSARSSRPPPSGASTSSSRTGSAAPARVPRAGRLRRLAVGRHLAGRARADAGAARFGARRHRLGPRPAPLPQRLTRRGRDAAASRGRTARPPTRLAGRIATGTPPTTENHYRTHRARCRA